MNSREFIRFGEVIKLVLAGLLAVSLWSCQTVDSQIGSAGGGAVTGKMLRVGVTANAPPMISKAGGKFTGLEAEMARALAQDLGRELRFVEVGWEGLIPALQQGRIDIIMSGMTATRERSMLVTFSDPYLGVGQTLLVRPEDLWTFEYPKVILATERRIGVEKGTTSDVFVQRYCPKAKRVVLSSPKQAVGALKMKRIDVFLHDAPVIWQLAAENQSSGVMAVPRLLTQENLGWALRKGDSDLLMQVNGVLSNWKKSGRLRQMVRTWIPIP